MPPSTTSHLRLHVEPAAGEAPAPWQADSTEIAPLCEAFQRATGWEIRLAGAAEGAGNEIWSADIMQADGSLGRLVVEQPFVGGGKAKSAAALLAFESVRPLALSLASLLTELGQTRHALWRREAELAAGVPVTLKPDETHLSERLTSVLKGGVEAVHADAAGLYLLDETTTSLKLRAQFNLPPSRFVDPARPLRGSVADLEALVGHAVVLEDTSLLPHWKCPEPFPSAVCVPVSSPTTPLGTLWVFSQTAWDFSTEQANLLEIIAGRLASDLEREMLVTAGVEAREDRRSRDAAARWRKDRLPQFAPLSDAWELTGWINDGSPGEELFDWTVLADGRIAFALAAVAGDRFTASYNAASLHAAWRAHAAHAQSADGLLAQLNDTIWSSSAGDFTATMGIGLLDGDGRLEYAAAGNIIGGLLQRDKRQLLGPGASALAHALGADCDLRFTSQRWELQKGELFALLSPGACRLCDEAGLRIGEAALIQLVQRHREESLEQIAAALRESLMARADLTQQSAAFVLARRKRR